MENEFILSRAELVYLLHELKCKTVVGVNLKELNQSDEELSVSLKQGQTLLNKKKDTVDYSQLVEFVEVLGKRDIGIVMIRGIKNLGRQLFIFNFYNGKIIEHTMPEEGFYRLALIPSFDALIERLKQIVSLAAVNMNDREINKISQPDFENIIKFVQSGNIHEAEKILEQTDFNQAYYGYLLQAIGEPEFTLSIACFKIQNDTAMETSSVSIFADQQSSWGVWPGEMEATPPILYLFPSGITDVFNTFSDWLHLTK